MTQDEATKGRSRALAWLPRTPGWVWVLLVTVAVPFLICWFWADIRDWMQEGEEGKTNGETLRNLMLILAPLFALPLAFWRSMTAQQQANVAQQQAGVAQQQAEVTQKQAEVAQKGLQNDRYQRGSEMLGSEALSTRISGIYALEHLARDHPEDYHIQIMDLLCAFIRNPQIRTNNAENSGQSSVNINRLAPDVQEALTVIGRRNQNQRDLEKKEEWQLDLSQTHLEGANLSNAHLQGADLEGAHLEGANLRNANLRSAFLMKAHLERAVMASADLEGALLMEAHLENAFLVNAHLEDTHLLGACLEGANLWNAYLKGSDLRNVHLERAILADAHLKNVNGLTQSMLDSTARFAITDKPLPSPDLIEAFCAESGEPLVWRTPPNFSPSSDENEPDPSLS